MKRITVYLPDELKAALARTTATATHAYPRPRLPLFHTGDPTLAERVDDVLAAGFGESCEV